MLVTVMQVLDTSIATAWSSLASEEQAMIDLAAQITSLQDQLNGFEGSLSSAEIRRPA